MKLTNTWKHALVGLVAGLVLTLITWLLQMVLTGSYAVFFIMAFALVTVVWEFNQKGRLLDSIVDIIAGNAMFILPFWIFGMI